MKQANSKSLGLSRISVMLFMAALAAIDLCGGGLVSWFLSFTRYHFPAGAAVKWMFLASLYLCSVPAWGVLILLNRLLKNIRQGRIFVQSNVSALRSISWCCIAAAVICLVSSAYYLPHLILVVAASFMALIVRVVKNCFEEATGMRDELDYTI